MIEYMRIIISQILKVIFVLNANFVSPTHVLFHYALRIYIYVCVCLCVCLAL